MATREGVDKEIAPDRPATKKQGDVNEHERQFMCSSTPSQRDLIARLLRAAPDARDLFEYEDYAAKPSAVTASEFITQALEQNADRFTDRKIFLEYTANRPRVQKLGAHGLFGDTNATVDLAAVQREVAEHPGNVWTNVVSLRREDAARLGYDNASAWRALMREKQFEIAGFMRNQVLQAYADKLPEPLPLSQQKEFKQIKNMIIQEAMRMDSQHIQPPARSAPVADAPINDAHNPVQAAVAADAASTAARLLRGLSKLFDDQRQKQTARADHIDRKRAQELRYKRQAQGLARDEQMQSQTY